MSSSEFETKGIRAVMIIEVLGRPPEHLKETLSNIIGQIDDEEGVAVREKKITEPKKIEPEKNSVEDSKNFDKKTMTHIEGLYTCFAEVEVEVEEIFNLALLMFKYMPAHIEIISPELIALTNNGWSDILTELVRRLHGYDEVARVMQVERAMIENKIKEITGEEDIMKIMGMGKENVMKKTKKKTSKKKSVKKKGSAKKKSFKKKISRKK